MKITLLQIHPYNTKRSGALISVTDENTNTGWGDVSPLPNWSRETLDDCLQEFQKKQDKIKEIDWTSQSCFRALAKLKLLPALSFGLESALLSILDPLPDLYIPTSALLMGSPEEILALANRRHAEGFTSAKLKVGHLSFQEASSLIHQLKDQFRLRIDVNRAWKTADSLRFFSEFALDTFDYVEEPFQNPHDLAQFTHPLAVDESFPNDLSLKKLESLPTLKALLYKPTIQGGMLPCIPLHKWATKRRIALILSSSFESDLGLMHIACIAYRLSIKASIGIGTYHFLKEHICSPSITFYNSIAHIPNKILIKK
jgi:O-succinylbenzoate synthase